LGGIFEEVEGDLSEEAVIGGDEYGSFGGFAVEFDFGVVEAILEGGGGFFDGRSEVSGFGGAGCGCSVAASEEQEAVGEAAHAIG
jgi:hypothetical protein